MPRRIVFCLAAGIAVGIILGEEGIHHILFLMGVTTLVFLIWRRRGFWLVVFLVSALLGAWRVQTVLFEYDRTTQAIVRHDGRVLGMVTKEWSDRGDTVVEIQQLQGESGDWRGSAKIRLPARRDIRAGTKVEVRCRWEAPAAKRRHRSAAQDLVGECRYPEEVFLRERSNDWRAFLARTRAALVKKIEQSYHAPQSDLLAGILLGVQESMTPELREGFRATGTSHIVALSGFNVTIIIAVVSASLSTLIGRRLAFWPLVGLVAAFVIMTGASASVTRAGVMALMVLVTAQLGRPIVMARVLAYTFVGMVVTNPLVLQYDLGFQLSFLATLGLVYVSGLLEARLRLSNIFSLRSNLSSTLAAMMVTEPLLLWTFGRLSLVAPFVNLAVLPLIPLCMATGALALVLPIAVPVTDALLRLVLAIIGAAAGWPVAQAVTPWWVAGGLAALCGYFVLRFIYDATKKASPDR